jgi:hypothetical protein
VGLVLWIDQNKVSTILLEKVFKNRGLGFYVLSSVNDFAYLIKELNPSVIVVDAQTAIKDLDIFRSQYEQTEGFWNVPVIVLNFSPELQFIKNLAGEIKHPIDPFSIPDQLNKMTM